MVLCKFFQTGNCRFGTKCTNEHLDVKQLVKTDVESAINGKQWPLSCFGPFKDKSCLPNFIEDQCFEEIRWLCYGSKKQNFFQEFHQQFSKEVLEAQNKMRAILTMTPEVVDVIFKLYDTQTERSSTAALTNPFGLAATGNGTIGQQANSIFGTDATKSSTGNIFANTSSGLFASASSGGGGLVGQSTFGSAPTGGGFANQQPNQPQQQQSIFGQQQKQTNSIFGGGASTTTATPSLFGQQPQNTGGLFVQAAQQPTQSGTSNIFAQAAAQTAAPQPGFGLFAQAAQQTTQPQPQSQQANLFVQQPQQGQGNVFAPQPMQQQPQQVMPGNPFTQSQQQPPSGLFAAAAAQANNIFGQPQQNVIPQNQSMQGNIFQQQPQPQQQTQQQEKQPAIADNIEVTIYSKMDSLTPEEIDAFKADSFVLGKIPFSPPPRELV